MTTLAEALRDVVRKLELEDVALEARALLLWPEVVGPQLARSSEPVRVRAGTLLVHTANSGWSQELSFQKERILREYARRLGKSLLKDLRCTVGPLRGHEDATLRPAPAEEEVRRIRLDEAEVETIRAAAHCDDPELEQAVRRALTREAQLRHWRLEHGARSCPQCGAAHRSSRPLCPACHQDRRVIR